jgi:hypothetical protein
MSQRLLSPLGLLTLLCGLAAAQGTPQGGATRSSRIEVTPQGAFLREEHGGFQVDASNQAATAAGALWSHGSGALGWIGSAVSIGNRASQVFTEYDLNSEAAELFSVYDANPPSAIWSDATALATEFREVASADATDAHVSIHQVVLNGNLATRQAVVRKYSSSSPVPDWSHTFAPIINAAARVGISRDGQTIATAVMDNNTWQVQVAVFGPGSGTPLSSGSVAVGTNNYLRGFDLSADGSTLYFSAGVTAYVYDLASHTVAFSTNIGSSFDSHAISGDGSVFAFGNFNVLRVWEKSGATYLNTHTVNKAGQVYCAIVDISDDSSTVAAAWYFYATGLSVAVEALDVPSKSITMTQMVTGTGGFQNAVGDVSCSADGERFAVGLWGDQGNVAAELRLYSSNQNAPLVTLNTPGSVFSIDLSADGQRVVGGSKAVHANVQGNGGRLDLLDAGGEDFILRGAPSIGSTISVEVHAPPAVTAAVLLTAQAESVPPVVFAGIGTLYIDRTTLVLSPLGPIAGGGVGSYPLQLANNPLLVGTSIYLQGLTLQPRTLTQHWVKLTYLP